MAKINKYVSYNSQYAKCDLVARHIQALVPIALNFHLHTWHEFLQFVSWKVYNSIYEILSLAYFFGSYLLCYLVEFQELDVSDLHKMGYRNYDRSPICLGKSHKIVRTIFGGHTDIVYHPTFSHIREWSLRPSTSNKNSIRRIYQFLTKSFLRTLGYNSVAFQTSVFDLPNPGRLRVAGTLIC